MDAPIVREVSIINEMESEGLLVLTSKYLTKNTITEMLGEMK